MKGLQALHPRLIRFDQSKDGFGFYEAGKLPERQVRLSSTGVFVLRTTYFFLAGTYFFLFLSDILY